MPKLSFLVLGLAFAIFFILFSLSLFRAQSLDGFDIVRNKKIVTVQNDIDPDIVFKIHCQSSEEDFREHMLYYKQSFQIQVSMILMEKGPYNGVFAYKT